MSIIRRIGTIDVPARTITMTLAMLIAAFFVAPARAQGPSDETWVAPARAGQKSNPLQPTTDVLKHGKELFHRDCEQCHGKVGKGDGPQSFSLEKHPADLSSARVQTQPDGAFFWKMTEGKGVMPKATLSDKDKWSVILYLRSLAAAH